MHNQVPVRVNTMVDSGIAELVTALSYYDGVYTFESCQGGSCGAYICLHYGSPTKPSLAETVRFASCLADILKGYSDCSVSIVFATLPTVLLEMNSASIRDVAVRVASQKNEFLCGKKNKALRN